jgi:hypothetical protein
MKVLFVVKRVLLVLVSLAVVATFVKSILNRGDTYKPRGDAPYQAHHARAPFKRLQFRPASFPLGDGQFVINDAWIESEVEIEHPWIWLRRLRHTGHSCICLRTTRSAQSEIDNYFEPSIVVVINGKPEPFLSMNSLEGSRLHWLLVDDDSYSLPLDLSVTWHKVSLSLVIETTSLGTRQ